tara:strand:- start:72 stop:1136 length:1065 start_codon:yes stop_codon:yes gene_type:complete
MSECPLGRRADCNVYVLLFQRSILPKVIWYAPPSGRWEDCYIEAVNGKAEEMHAAQWGGELATLVGQRAEVAWPSLKDFLVLVRAAAEKGKGTEIEYAWTPDKRQPRLYRVYISQIDDNRALVVYQDITEQRRRQDDLDWFASAASHDLRSPLVGAATALSRMKTHLLRDGVEIPARAAKWLVHVEASLEMMARKVAAFVDYVRAPGASEQTFLFRLAVKDALEGLSTRVQWTPPAYRVRGNRDAVGIALHQLFTNSRKYAHADRPLEVSIRCREVGDRLRFCVEDNGIGVDPKELTNIFMPRKRLHGQEIPGVGLGLATARRIFEAHGMPVWAESDGSSGLTVCFELERADDG